MKKIFAGLTVAFLLLFTPVSGWASSRTVTDMTGRKVKVPAKVERVADLWHANNQVVLLLGGAEKAGGNDSVD